MLQESGFFSPSKSDFFDDYSSPSKNFAQQRAPKAFELITRVNSASSSDSKSSYIEIDKEEATSPTSASKINEFLVSEQTREESIWATRAQFTRVSKKAEKFIDKVKDELPFLIYANIDKSTYTILGSNIEEWRNNHQSALGQKKRKKEQISENWLFNSCAEVNLPNPLQISFLNTSQSHPLVLAWYTDSTPSTVYLELSNLVQGGKDNKSVLSDPFNFSFMARMPSIMRKPITFKILNTMPRFEKFQVNSRESSNHWHKDIQGKVVASDDLHLGIDHRIRHRAEKWKVLEWTWVPSEEAVESEFLEVEFALTLKFEVPHFEKEITALKDKTGIQLKFLSSCFNGIPARYFLLCDGKGTRLSQMKEKQIVVFNFWEGK